MSCIERLLEILKHPPKGSRRLPIWWWSGDRLEIERLR